jgi:CelD/BcsL family acetyltransferase involved in cellulose biosynthesis
MIKTLPLSVAVKTLDLPGFDRNLFSSLDWLTVIERTYAPKLFIKYIERDGRIQSYIIYSAVRNFLEHKICICSYCDYFDCFVQSADEWQLFFDDIRREYPMYRIAIRNLRDSAVRSLPQLQVLSKEWLHLLDARDSLENLWKKTNDSFRAAVNQARRMGVTVSVGKKSDLAHMYQMHLSLRKTKYKIFSQPYQFFENIWRVYMDNDKGFLLCAYDPDGKMIAATIYLICGDTLYYKINTSSAGSLKYRPNNILFWEGIKIAKERGLDYIDMGSSGWDQKGLALFKDHTGGKRYEITHLGFAPSNYKFSKKRILRLYTQICTLPWMPDAVVKYGAKLIYPFLA